MPPCRVILRTPLLIVNLYYTINALTMENLFERYGSIKNGIQTLTPREAYEAIKDGALYIDLRAAELSAYKIPDIPDIFLLPLALYKEAYHKLPAERYLILADSSGLKSRDVASFLQDRGYDKVSHMAGGFVEWERDGLPIREDINERLTGACACQLKPRDRMK